MHHPPYFRQGKVAAKVGSHLQQHGSVLGCLLLPSVSEVTWSICQVTSEQDTLWLK